MAKGEARTSRVGEVAWSDLDRDSQDVMRWAKAMEREAVGTRAMLIGMIRARGDRSEASQTLRAADVRQSALFDALQAAVPAPSIKPMVAMSADLTDMPPLSPNATRALRRAASLRSTLDDPDALISPAHLFGALLDLQGTTAYRGLGVVLPEHASMRQVREVYEAYLRSPEGIPLDERLEMELVQRPSLDKLDLKHGHSVTAIAFAPDGRELASVGGTTIRLWDPLTGEAFEALGDSASQGAVTYSHDDGALLAYADDLGHIFMRERRSGSTKAIRKFGTAALALAFSPDGHLIAALKDGTVGIWDGRVFTSRVPADLVRGISTVALSPDGARLARADDDGLIWVFDTWTGEQVYRIQAEATSVIGLAFAPRSDRRVPRSDRLAYAGSDGRIGIWDPFKRVVEHIDDAPAGPTLAVAFSPDGSRLASGGADGSVRVCDPVTRKVLAVSKVHNGPVRAVAFSGTLPQLASAGDDGLVRLWDPASPAGPVPNDRVEWLADAPARVDKLGRADLARALATRLDRVSDHRDDEDDSFLVHVDGPWGTGKSSMLRFLGEQLDGEKWTVVRFDAWRQARVGPPWWSLLTGLRKALRDSRSHPRRVALRASETSQRIWRDGASYLLSLSILAAAAAGLLIAGPVSGGLGEVARTLSAVIAAVTALWVVGRVVARFLMWDSATAARLFEQSHQDPMESLAEHFAWLLSQSEGRVIFFIDDLDRCDSDYVVDLLDSVQTLVRDAPRKSVRKEVQARQPYFVVAADGRWIRQSYEVKYEAFDGAVGEPGRPLGYLFLDKIFQLTVRIPAVGAGWRESFLKDLLDPSGGETTQATASYAAQLAESKRRIEYSSDQETILEVHNNASAEMRASLSDTTLEKLNEEAVERSTEHELQKFASLLEPNPRSMKRFLNAYGMALSTQVLEGRHIEPDQLALWTILSMRWPDLADHLRTVPGDIDALTGDGQDPLREIAHLRPLAAIPDLVRVVRFNGSLLTAAAISELCGTDLPLK
jgi:KAP family P-loop domain/WD domain, G-beta repeat